MKTMRSIIGACLGIAAIVALAATFTASATPLIDGKFEIHPSSVESIENLDIQANVIAFGEIAIAQVGPVEVSDDDGKAELRTASFGVGKSLRLVGAPPRYHMRC